LFTVLCTAHAPESMKAKILQFLLGSVLGLSLMAAVGAGALFIVVQQLTARPPRPTFENDDPNFAARQRQTPKPSPSGSGSPGESPSPSDSPSPSASPEGSYRATVSFPDGLSVRDAPDGTQIGGVGYQETLIVLEESSDKRWLKVRSEATQIEGWIKAGNVTKVE
jgi:Bacterial SH3 domain